MPLPRVIGYALVQAIILSIPLALIMLVIWAIKRHDWYYIYITVALIFTIAMYFRAWI